jgi:hypothetical protein
MRNEIAHKIAWIAIHPLGFAPTINDPQMCAPIEKVRNFKASAQSATRRAAVQKTRAFLRNMKDIQTSLNVPSKGYYSAHPNSAV